MPKNKPKLLPCPFCGCSKINLIYGYKYYTIQCPECLIDMCFFTTKADIIKEWNQRTEPMSRNKSTLDAKAWKRIWIILKNEGHYFGGYEIVSIKRIVNAELRRIADGRK